MKHLLGIDGLERREVETLLSRSGLHKQALAEGRRGNALSGKTVANLFFEDSTRTRTSFEFAARNLGADVLNWTASGSSVSKGEALVDTVRNLEATGPAALVIRHASSGAPHLAARWVHCAVINAGDGTHEHPSQALLDAFTLKEKLGTLEGKRILLVGDILHSRVARSNLFCLRLLGAEVVVCGPPTLIPAGLSQVAARVTSDLDGVLPEADAVMMLRIQLERQQEAHFPSAREYARLYGLSVARAGRMKPGAPVLHPGPMNRGVEIAPQVADGPSSVILEQVRNGVAVRMAILEACA